MGEFENARRRLGEQAAAARISKAIRNAVLD
jgi:hypothetical protein